MYRKRASKSALQGVLSGPYAGGSRTLDVARLPRHVRQRVADVLAYRAEPSPLLHDRPQGAARFRASWALVASLFAFLLLTAYRLGDPRSALAIYPPVFLALYAAPSAGIVFSLLALVRRRARVGGDSLSPGRWLLPLDVVDVQPPDAEGRQRIVVTPLGDARDAEARGRELVLSFVDGSAMTFPLRADADGEATLKRLEHAQHLLEDLTYGRHLEKALAQDPFFDVRVDGSWGELAAAPLPPRREQLLHGRSVTLAAGALAATVTLAGWAGRNRISDRALFLHAARMHTPEAYDAYLARGKAYRALALGLRDEAVHQRKLAEEESARRAAEERAQQEEERTPLERCIDGLRSRGAQPRVVQMLAELLADGDASRPVLLPVTFEEEIDRSVPEDVARELALREHRTTVLRALRRAFSGICTTSVGSFVEAGDKADGAVLAIHYRVSRGTGPAWHVATGVALPVVFAFDVHVPNQHGGDASSFHLTMPAPSSLPVPYRDRSLFVASDEEEPRRTYAAMSARAFDRLYDEVYGLFLAGDPIVPLRNEDWIVAPPGSGSQAAAPAP